MKTTFLTALLGVLTGAAANAQPNFAIVEIKATHVESALRRVPSDAKIIPGHGALATRQDLETFHQMLVETTGIVQRAIAAGKTLQQVKADGLPEKWKEWGTGFINTDRWLEITYNSLSQKK